ncbi:hypothetical protein KY495_15930 [Massilia sp. PAMC28688]|uniref:hypothetical protein n=1 Tax=Massilia sp. PAMC28688 TaxID=2861283 RepID=UPI001C62C12C|nr:hypothetical protein [Massilia sp. PAMC28688]QYF92241.1 hypothetical protein KY495_15930 [Massilia sp. PAMC28688]
MKAQRIERRAVCESDGIAQRNEHGQPAVQKNRKQPRRPRLLRSIWLVHFQYDHDSSLSCAAACRRSPYKLAQKIQAQRAAIAAFSHKV